MLIQPMTNQFNYRNYQQQKVNKSTSFKGELGAKVLKEISTSGAKDQKGIAQVLKTLGLGFMGLFSLSKLTDILEAVAVKNDELEKRETSIINTEHLLKDAEKSSLRALYGIEDSELEKAESLSEQMLHINSILSENSNKILDAEPSTPVVITKALRNKDNMIDTETLTFFNRLIAMIDKDNAKDIEQAISCVKDSSGNLDTEKAAQFLILMSNKQNSLRDVTSSLSSEIPATKKDENYIVNDTEFGFGKVKLTKKAHKKYVDLMSKLRSCEAKLQSQNDYLHEFERTIDWRFTNCNSDEISRYRRKCSLSQPRIRMLQGKIASLEVKIKSILENSKNTKV